MKKLIAQYAAYNVWANQVVTDCINNLADDQIEKEIKSSFPSLFKTLLHLWDAESRWWQRIKLVEVVTSPSESFTGSIMELSQQLMLQSRQWKEWVDLATEAALEHEFIYKNTKRDQFKQPIYEALHHLFNHQSYHRGQIITMLRQVDAKEIPNTDLISFLRKK